MNNINFKWKWYLQPSLELSCLSFPPKIIIWLLITSTADYFHIKNLVRTLYSKRSTWFHGVISKIGFVKKFGQYWLKHKVFVFLAAHKMGCLKMLQRMRNKKKTIRAIFWNTLKEWQCQLSNIVNKDVIRRLNNLTQIV